MTQTNERFLCGLTGGCRRPDFLGHVIFWSVAIVGFAADVLSKRGIFAWIEERGVHGVAVIENFFYIVRAENTGAAFGIASGQRVMLVGISILAMLAIVGLFFVVGVRGRTGQIAMGLFTAGLCGNLYDRIFNDGRVRDFIDVVYWPGKHWPAFNLADIFLCVAVGLMVLMSFIGQPDQKHDPQQK
ncbi:MAG: signal peptidase II [Phycisphaerae bacterium]|nr:signal peptidase II [Phycisphaerae bacterium]